MTLSGRGCPQAPAERSNGSTLFESQGSTSNLRPSDVRPPWSWPIPAPVKPSHRGKPRQHARTKLAAASIKLAAADPVPLATSEANALQDALCQDPQWNEAGRGPVGDTFVTFTTSVSDWAQWIAAEGVFLGPSPTSRLPRPAMGTSVPRSAIPPRPGAHWASW